MARQYLGLGGRIVDGRFQVEEVSILDKPVDPNCFVDWPEALHPTKAENVKPREFDYPFD